MRSLLTTTLLTLALPAFAQQPAPSPTPAVVDPTIQYQRFEGWGTSLAWWAKVIGSFPEPARTDYVEKAFDPVKGLGLNVVRYNIGGGENPAFSAPNKSYLGFREAVPGFEPAKGQWDWSADAPQRWVLQEAIRRGADQLEAFSNSPPYWMTVSGSVTGAKGGQDNLKPDEDADFADYLATVVRHFQTDGKITFRDLEPLNEPDGHWWTLGNHQEGCFVERPHQNAIVKATSSALPKAGVRGVSVAAPDSNRIQDADRMVADFDADAVRDLSKINVHSYGGGDRTQLSNWAITHGKDLWLSEYGDGDASGMQMSRAIVTDMTLLHPGAWCYWQVVDNAGGWGFLRNPLRNSVDTSYVVNEKYWVMANYSRFIRPGFRMIAIDEKNSLAAYDEKNHRLVIVTTNDSQADRTTDFDLSRFATVGGAVGIWRTSTAEPLAKRPDVAISGKRFSATLPARSVTTFVVAAEFGGKLGIDYRASFRIVNEATGGDARVGSGTGAVRWGLIGVGDGWYTLVDRETGKALDVPQASTDAGVSLLEYADNGGNNQLWRLDEGHIVNRNSGLALAPLATGGLTQEKADGSARQRWRITETK